MKKNRIFLYSAVGCILAGGILFGGGIALGGSPQFSITKTGLHLKNEGEEGYLLPRTKIDSFTDISVKAEYADIEILPSGDRDFYVEYSMPSDFSEPEMKAEDGCFQLKEQEEKGFFNIDFSFLGIDQDTREYYVRLYVPSDAELNTVRLESGSGNIKWQELYAKDSVIKAGYGDVVFHDYEGQKLEVTADSGNIRADSIKADQTSVYSGYGDLDVTEIKGGSGEIKLDSGDMEIGKNDMEDLNITSGYGDVELGSTDGWEAYDLDLYTDYGEIKLNGYDVSGDMEQKLKITKDNEKHLKIICDSGDITLN